MVYEVLGRDLVIVGCWDVFHILNIIAVEL